MSEDVVIVKRPGQEEATPASVRKPPFAPDTELRVIPGDDVVVEAGGCKGKPQGSILVEQNPRPPPRAVGTVEVEAGVSRVCGRDLWVQRGRVPFTVGLVDNPGLDLDLAHQVDDVTAGARIRRTVNPPQPRLDSDPTVPDTTVPSYLILGRAPMRAPPRRRYCSPAPRLPSVSAAAMPPPRSCPRPRASTPLASSRSTPSRCATR